MLGNWNFGARILQFQLSVKDNTIELATHMYRSSAASGKVVYQKLLTFISKKILQTSSLLNLK